MANAKNAIALYERMILRNETSLMLTGSKEEREEDALSIIRYIIRELLLWTPEEAADHMDAYYAKVYHMDMLARYIITDHEMIVDEDYKYLLHKAFPKELWNDPVKNTIRTYEKILNGELTKFPKGFFYKVNGGRLRATILLSYAIENFEDPELDSEYALFQLFSNVPKANKKIEEWKLTNACRNIYNNKPLDYLYDTMGDDPGTKFLYDVFSFKKAFEKSMRTGKPKK